MLDSQAFGGGFVDPVFQSQAVFRAVMDAMARPGSIHAIARDALLPPARGIPGGALVCDGVIAERTLTLPGYGCAIIEPGS